MAPCLAQLCKRTMQELCSQTHIIITLFLCLNYINYTQAFLHKNQAFLALFSGSGQSLKK